MKKLPIILASLVVVATLCSCGEGAQQSAPQTNDASQSHVETTVQNAKVGDILDKPEKVFEGDQFYCYFQYPDSSNETGIGTAEVTLKDDANTNSGILYISDGPLKLHEEVLVNNSDGSITRYYKDTFMEKLVKDTESTEAQLNERKEKAISCLILTGYSLTESLGDLVKYKKCEDKDLPLTGDAYVYDVIENGKTVGTIMINKETGLFAKWMDENGKEVMSAQKISVTDVEIPEYE